MSDLRVSKLMDIVEVKLLKYVFQFRPLSWREESAIKFDLKKDRMRTLLSYALVEVSGLKIKSPQEAMKVLEAVPLTVIQRVFILYRGALPVSKMFKTVGLYKAPESAKFGKRLEEAEEQTERIMDKVEKEMEQKFGRKELEETRANERLMAINSKLRGVTKPTPDTPEDR